MLPAFSGTARSPVGERFGSQRAWRWPTRRIEDQAATAAERGRISDVYREKACSESKPLNSWRAKSDESAHWKIHFKTARVF
jgi:hypothetical protein